MAHQVFISYGHQDKLVADAACARLEARGIRCWIAPRDVLAGQSYGEALSNAIRSCRVLVLVFSSHANFSEHVSKEVERAVSHSIPVVPLRIENVAPTGALDYFIGSVHWLDALTDPIDQHLERLGDTVERLLGQDDGRRIPPPPPPKPTPWQRYALIAGAALIVLIVVIAFFKMGGRPTQDFTQADIQPTVPQPAAPAAIPPAAVAAPAPVPAARTKPANAPPRQSNSQPTIIGCWLYNGQSVRVQQDGRVTGWTLEAQWTGSGNQYSFRWPEPVETVRLSADGRSATGVTNFGTPVAGTRLSVGSGGPLSLGGVWQWNGGVATMADDGNVTAGVFRARWAPSGNLEFKITWTHAPVDQLTLSDDGQQLRGNNQFGAQVGGQRVPCAN